MFNFLNFFLDSVPSLLYIIINKHTKGDIMTLSEFIISYRKEKGISQRRLAELCKLSNGYISMLEKGRNPKTNLPIVPALPQLNKLCKGMGISISELFLRVDDINVELPTIKESGTIISEDDIKVALFGGNDKNVDKKFEEVKRYIEFLNSKEEG